MRNPFKRRPAPPAFGRGKVLPELSASPWAILVFSWLNPFLSVGYSRPLEVDDLWELPPKHLTSVLTDKLESNFYTRCPPEKRPKHLRQLGDPGISESSPTLIPVESADDEKEVKNSEEKGDQSDPANLKTNPGKDKLYDSSLTKALHRTFLVRWWTAGLMKFVGAMLQTTTPLVNKQLLSWLTQSYFYYRLSDQERALGIVNKPRGIGYGIGLAIAIFSMQEVASLLNGHYFLLTMSNGIYVRTAVIGNIFRKALRLSERARLEHSAGQITTMISADASRLDRFSAFGHNIWVAPAQIAVGIALLINNLGYSALVGLGVLVFGFPLQMILVRVMFAQRLKGVKITDKRVLLTTEVLQGIRLIKFFSWEAFYTEQIGKLRWGEIKTIRKVAIARSLLVAVVTAIPVIASILSFVTYSLTKHDLNIAIIFSSLQFFNIIRTPLLFLPFVLSSLTDALVAIGRISKFLEAEELADPYTIDYEGKTAVEVDGDFTWETVRKPTESDKFGKKLSGADAKKNKASDAPKKKQEKAKKSKKSKGESTVLPTTANPMDTPAPGTANEDPTKEDEKPFELRDLKMKVPKGSFIAIVGRVGSGKSSVLQAMIGEMRRTKGNVTFGGSVAYCPQTAWIRNASVRDNVTFGQEFDETRFRAVVQACSLEHDLKMLPNGEETEIGERGINVSGGQKARISLARAAYSTSDVVLLDDPLSAVDAYVGKDILDRCLLTGPLANRTRVLVTHALHVLDKTDYIYVIENGRISEEGTYHDLLKDSIVFSRLMEEYGSLEHEKVKRKEAEAGGAASKTEETIKKPSEALMQTEERNTGSITWATYANYFRYAGGIAWAPAILFFLVLNQGAAVGNNLFLGFWTGNTIHGFKSGQYMGVYAALGVAQAMFAFCLTFTISLATLYASLHLFKAALTGVLRSPTAFFDTTPTGRILSRLSKDLDTLDTEIALTLWQLLSTFGTIIGTVGLVFYAFPLLGTIFPPLFLLYFAASAFYRKSSVETKRLDSLLRSHLYSTYSETLTGLSTIRAYNAQGRAIASAEHSLDMQNRAYYMTVAIQRWLGVRLDFLGNLLLLGVGLFAAGFRNTVAPSKIGVVLSYTLSLTQIFSDMVQQFAQNEQNMNAVERVLVYSDLPSEGDLTTPNDPPPSWPEKGEIKFVNVDLAYRPGLPLVLKDISFQIRPGEKVGIVGRTGAGKSSLLQALFRIVGLQRGRIEIDGYDTQSVGLEVLRSRLALVPQDSTLFLGTLRENLDPQNSRTDSEMISVLQRAWLLPKDGQLDPVAEAKFSLDSAVNDDGGNFSAGEKQLLALCRALVKNSRIIVLDEATSSVDVETDAKIQRTIQTEFANSTLLCIAHRLNTIAYYDRVLVMDAGEVAEYDTVLNLFDKEDSIFRSLCNEAGLSRADILKIRADVANVLNAQSSTSI